MENKLKYRMYFFVPYNISPIQQAIQAGHSMGEYCLKYGRFDPAHIIWEFLEQWKTWIILNGGTTNDTYNFDMIATGTLNQINDELFVNKIEFSQFREPDLNNALTAVCFLADERVWDYETYPDLTTFLMNEYTDDVDLDKFRANTHDFFKAQYPIAYTKWEEMMGGEKNVFLRNLLKGKKLA